MIKTIYILMLQFPSIAVVAPELSNIERYGIAAIAIPVAIVLHRLNQQNLAKLEDLHRERIAEKDTIIGELRQQVNELIAKLNK